MAQVLSSSTSGSASSSAVPSNVSLYEPRQREAFHHSMPSQPSSTKHNPATISSFDTSNDAHHNHKAYPSPPLSTVTATSFLDAKSLQKDEVPLLTLEECPEKKMLETKQRRREVVAVDLDETLAVTHDAIIHYHNLKYGTSHSLMSFRLIRMLRHGVAMVKSVQLVFHYPGVFDGVVFVGGPGPTQPTTPSSDSPSTSSSIPLARPSTTSTQKRTKSQACREIGATILVDDSIEHAADCAASGIDVLLFDLDGAMPARNASETVRNGVVVKEEARGGEEEVKRELRGGSSRGWK
ncbi:hypothetical protein BC829DRAFT_418930 [Chytridium lagenaria]|nr:hypothetical protein BC829DRAFT_418930 [Chytridium lagenaria]